MIVALIDNGSLEPAATLNLRAVAAALSARTGVTVEAVSWKHSDRITQLTALGGQPAKTLAPWLKRHLAKGARDFLFIPFFISAQGAIGSALRTDLEKLQGTHKTKPFRFSFTDSLAACSVISRIVVTRIQESITANGLVVPPVLVVDHGGPSAASAAVRDQIATEVRTTLGSNVASVTAASMEGAHSPLFADALAALPTAQPDVIVAPLFLSPGRHAGAGGDLAQIAASSPARVQFTELVGTHPLAVEALASALRSAIPQAAVA